MILYQFFKKNIYLICLFLFFFTAYPLLVYPISSYPSNNIDQKGFKSYYLNNYPLLSEDQQDVQRTKKIFIKLKKIADISSNRTPNLLFLKKCKEDAFSIVDGTIILTQKAMNICYQKSDSKLADTRMAFVLSHELAHLSHNDFKKLIFIETFFNGDLFNKTSYQKEIEQEADSKALIISAQGGYDPNLILTHSDGDFFQIWAEHICSDVDKAKTNNQLFSPSERASFLIKEIKSLGLFLNLYACGVRFAQIGMSDDALELFTAFRIKYPGSEVLNNIGLMNYQLALKTMYTNNQITPFKYQLSTIVETKTSAKVFKLRKNNQIMSYYSERLKNAIFNFKKAYEKNDTNTNALINLSSAHIMADNISEAKSILSKYIEKNPGNSSFFDNNLAVIYQIEGNNDQACSILKNLIKSYPNFSPAFFNLGMIYFQENKKELSHKMWQKYLSLEQQGFFAEFIYSQHGLARHYKKCHQANVVMGLEPPVKLGQYLKRIPKTDLNQYSQWSQTLGSCAWQFYYNDLYSITAMDDIISMVECKIEKDISEQELIDSCGIPCRIVHNIDGEVSFIYENFMIDLANQQIKKIVFWNSDIVKKF